MAGTGRGFLLDFFFLLLRPAQTCLFCCRLFWSGKDELPSTLLNSICPLLEIPWQWIIRNQGDCFVTTNLLSPSPPAALMAISVNYLKFLVLHTESSNQCSIPGIWLGTPNSSTLPKPHLSKCLFSLVQPLVFIQHGECYLESLKVLFFFQAGTFSL